MSKKKIKYVRFDQETNEWLDAQALEQDRTVASVVRVAVNEYRKRIS